MNALQSGAVYNNRALARLASRSFADARISVERALQEDPNNPIFLTTAGYVAALEGDAGRRDL